MYLFITDLNSMTYMLSWSESFWFLAFLYKSCPLGCSIEFYFFPRVTVGFSDRLSLTPHHSLSIYILPVFSWSLSDYFMP